MGFYAPLAARLTGAQTPWILGRLVVVGSIMVRGITTTRLILGYGRLGDDARVVVRATCNSQPGPHPGR